MGEPFFDCQIGFVGCRALCLKGIMGVRDFEENMNRREEVKTAQKPQGKMKKAENLSEKDKDREFKSPEQRSLSPKPCLRSLYCSQELSEGGRDVVWFVYGRVRSSSLFVIHYNVLCLPHTYVTVSTIRSCAVQCFWAQFSQCLSSTMC